MDELPRIVALSKSDTHSMVKPNHQSVNLIADFGIEGDVHAGIHVQHLSRLIGRKKPNLRQVHLIHQELFDELKKQGFDVSAGQMGENITTQNLDVLNLPQGTLLHIGETAVLQVTGLRNPCKQLNGIYPGLMKAVLGRAADGSLIRKAGIMTVVMQSGTIRVNDKIRVEYPPEPYQTLVCV